MDAETFLCIAVFFLLTVVNLTAFALRYQDRRNAARYKWLRSQNWSDNSLCVTFASNVKWGADVPSGARLDMALDAALRGRDVKEHKGLTPTLPVDHSPDVDKF